MKDSAKGRTPARDPRAFSPLSRPLSPQARTWNPKLPSGASTPWSPATATRARRPNVLSPRTPVRPRQDVRVAKLEPPSRATGRSPQGNRGQTPLSPTPESTTLHQTTDAKFTEQSKLAENKQRLFFGIFADDEEGSLEYSVHMAACTIGFSTALFFITFAASAYFPHCDDPVRCFDLASELRGSRDVDVDPCDDLFEHVCGRWTSMYPEQQDLFEILNNRLRVSLLEHVERVTADSNSAVDKVAAAITACMSVPEAGIDHRQTIRDVLRQRGLTFPSQEVRSTHQVFGILVALTLQDLLGVFFQLKLTPYLKEHDRLVFELKYAETMYRYVSEVEVLERCILAYEPNLQDVQDLAERLHNVETDVKTITMMHTSDNEQPQYRKFSDIDDIYGSRIQQDTGMKAQWWVDEINEHIPKDAAMTLESDFLLRHPYALLLTFDVLRAYSTSSLELQTYIAWKVIKYLSYAASSKMSSCHFPEDTVHWSSTFAKTLQRCTNYVKLVAPHALLKLQTQSVLDDETINYTITIANRIQHHLELSYNFSWFDPESALGVINRLRSVHQIIGMASKLRSNAALNSYYSHIPKYEAQLKFVEWFVRSLRAVAAHKKRFLQPTPGSPAASINRDDWDLSGISVGAYYVIVYHIIYLPGSILMPPFMVPYGPDPYNYGAIGKVIGHELTHAFDPKFIDVSPKGEKHIFYSPKFAQKLAELQECIILQANKLTESAVAGNNSVSEAFADSAGVEVAHLAYSSLPEPDRKAGTGQYTADQTFFAGTCYMFCQASAEYSEFSIYLPHRIRCKQPCLNTQEFAKAFGCKEGSPMFPRHRCDAHDFLAFAQRGH